MRRRHSIVFIALVWAAFWLILPERSLAASGQAGKSDLALVLAVDASASIDEGEFKLQLNGIAKAFREPEVLEAIRSGQIGKIDVALLVWAEQGASTKGSRWFRIGSEAEAERFAAHVESVPRRISGSTAVGNAIMSALVLLRDPSVLANRHCIDLSGDGRETIVPHSRSRATTPSLARAVAEDLHVTINALAIESEERDLARWYHRNIVTTDGFVAVIDAAEVFGNAIQLKLIKEIRGP